jgi:aryl-alcohol dehydrogenase-like predicted oxidoreductase
MNLRSLPIVGFRTMEQMKELAGTLTRPLLSAGDLQAIEETVRDSAFQPSSRDDHGGRFNEGEQ